MVLDVGVVVACISGATVDTHCMEGVRIISQRFLAFSVNDIKSAGVNLQGNRNFVTMLYSINFSVKVEVEDFRDVAEPSSVLLISQVALVVLCVSHYSSLLMIGPDLDKVCLVFVGKCQINILEFCKILYLVVSLAFFPRDFKDSDLGTRHKPCNGVSC